ncbi:MAG: MMPL family transporter [Thermoleophilia bacterium]
MTDGPALERARLPSGPFARVGRWSARHHRAVIAVWFVVLVALGVFAPRLQDQLTPGGFQISGSTSDRARQILERDFATAYPTGVTLLVSSDTLKPGDPAFDRVVQRVAAAVRAQAPLVGAATTPVQNPALAFPAKHLALVSVGFTRNLDQALRDTAPVLAAARAQATPAVRVEATSGPAIFADFNTINQRDLTRAERFQVPFVLYVLAMFFGSIVAAAVPVLATVVALVCTLGGLFFLAQAVDLSIYVHNVVPLIGIGVGIDYSLFVVSRYRDEVREGRTPGDAAAVTTATAGKAIVFSGLTVAVALAGMLAVGVPLFTGFAVGTISVVMVAVAVGITLTPAVMVAAGGWLFRLDARAGLRRLLRRPPRREGGMDGFWMRWAHAVMRRPWRVLLATSGVMLLLALPALHMTTGSSGVTALPRTAPSRLALDRYEAAAGPGAASPLQVVLSGATHSLRGSADLARLVRVIAGDPGTARVLPAINFSRDGRAAEITVFPADPVDSPAGEDYAARLGTVLPAAVPGLHGLHVDVGGAASQDRDFNRAVAGSLFRVIGLVMALTFLVLLVLFRSPVLALKAVLMTLLSVVASYGVLVLVFQRGWLDGPLGFHHLGHVSNWVPPFLFCILFGLSMDYEVFLLSRVREFRTLGRTDAEAVAAALARTGRIISAAATIMVVVFLSFLTNRLIPLKELSLGLAVAVFLDATLVRLLLVPAFMRLAGRWNWWLPGPLDRILPRLEE